MNTPIGDGNLTPVILTKREAFEDLREEVKKIQKEADPKIVNVCRYNPLLIKSNPDGENLYLGYTLTLDNRSNFCFFWSKESEIHNDRIFKTNTIDSYYGEPDAWHRLQLDNINDYNTLAKLIESAIPDMPNIMPIVEMANDELIDTIK